MILKHGVWLVAGQPLALSVCRKQIIAEAPQAGVRPHPEVAFAVLEKAAHLGRRLLRLAGEMVAFEARQTFVGSHPDDAIAVAP